SVALTDLLQWGQPSIGAHKHYFKYSQRKDRVKSLPLRYVPWRMRQSIESILDLTCKHRNEPEHASEKGCLTSAIGAEQCEELATLNGERNALKHHPAVIAKAQVPELK